MSDILTMQTHASPAAMAAAQARDVLRRLEAVEVENAQLGQDLLRCYEQLNLVYEITEYIATLQEPAVIRDTLLRRYASLMRAGAIFVFGAESCTAIGGFESEGAPVTIAADDVHTACSQEVQNVRRTSRAAVITAADLRARLGGAHVLLGLLRDDNEPLVVAVLRAAPEEAFDSSDMLAADSVLGYGGHVLNNVVMGRRLQQTAIETVRALAQAIDAKDNYTSGHSERVGWLARLVGTAMELPPAELQMLGWAGLLHDVGKIGVPEHILNKPGKLTDEEFAEIKRHPQIGYDVLKPVTHFGPVLDAVLYHHENHDGTGYPKGLSGDAIPVAARIVHVVDIFDALTSSRSYRKGFPVSKALDILRQESGRVTHPDITAVFIQAIESLRNASPQEFAKHFPHIVELEQSAGGAV